MRCGHKDKEERERMGSASKVQESSGIEGTVLERSEHEGMADVLEIRVGVANRGEDEGCR